jgi:hypothetical protein
VTARLVSAKLRSKWGSRADEAQRAWSFPTSRTERVKRGTRRSAAESKDLHLRLKFPASAKSAEGWATPPNQENGAMDAVLHSFLQ